MPWKFGCSDRELTIREKCPVSDGGNAVQLYGSSIGQSTGPNRRYGSESRP